MGIEKFFRTSYAATISKGEVYLRPFALIMYDKERSTFVKLHYAGDAISLADFKSDGRDLTALGFKREAWRYIEDLSLTALLDQLWDDGATLGLIRLDPHDVTPEKLGKWYYGSTMRLYGDNEPVTLDSVRIAGNEVLDNNAWARGDSYMHVGGGGENVGIVYGTDNDDEPAVRLATYINEKNNTDFGLPGFRGVDDIGCCGGTGSMCDNDLSVISYAVLSRSSSDESWFLSAAVSTKEYALVVKGFLEEDGAQVKVVALGSAKDVSGARGGGSTPTYILRAKLDEASARDRAGLQAYMVNQIVNLLEASKKTGLEVLRNLEHPVMGQRLLDAADPAAYMDRVLSALPDEVLVELCERALSIAANGVVGMNSKDFYIASANALIQTLADSI